MRNGDIDMHTAEALKIRIEEAFMINKRIATYRLQLNKDLLCFRQGKSRLI